MLSKLQQSKLMQYLLGWKTQIHFKQTTGGKLNY